MEFNLTAVLNKWLSFWCNGFLSSLVCFELQLPVCWVWSVLLLVIMSRNVRVMWAACNIQISLEDCMLGSYFEAKLLAAIRKILNLLHVTMQSCISSSWAPSYCCMLAQGSCRMWVVFSFSLYGTVIKAFFLFLKDSISLQRHQNKLAPTLFSLTWQNIMNIFRPYS